MNNTIKLDIQWNENLSEHEWDDHLTNLQGHPLQSAEWGKSRRVSCGIKDHRWCAFVNGSPIFMARFEERIFFKFIKIAWMPKGPVLSEQQDESVLYKNLLKKLKEKGFFLCAMNPWKKIELSNASYSDFYTIWIDLTQSKEKLFANLNKQCRYDIKRAKKLGVTVIKTKSQDDLDAFYLICESISRSKKFQLGNSSLIMSFLLSNNNNVNIESCVFIAKHQDNICGGAFIMRCGKNIHYLWGAVDRNFSHLCIGELLQWEIIEWASEKKCTKYDMEGISVNQDSGVDKFKKKFGGTVVAFSGIQYRPLYFGKTLILFFLNIYLKVKSKTNKYINR